MASESQKLRVQNRTKQMVTLILPLEQGAKRLELQKSNHDRQTGEVTVETVIKKLPTSLTLLPAGMEGSVVDDLPVSVGHAPDFKAKRAAGTIVCTVYDPAKEAEEKEAAEAEKKKAAEERAATRKKAEDEAAETAKADAAKAEAAAKEEAERAEAEAKAKAEAERNQPAKKKGSDDPKVGAQDQKGATGAKGAE